MGQQRPICHIDQLFSGQPARPLNKTAFNLTFIQGRVKRMSCIMQNIRPHNPAFACQRVDRNLRQGHTISKIIIRLAGQAGIIPVNIRGGINLVADRDTRPS